MSGLFTIGPGAGFLDTVATAWLDACGRDPVRSGDGLILLPTRRGVRALTDAFLRVSHQPALLLPRIGAIGAVDEAPLAIAGDLDLPPAIGRLPRLAWLARLVLARGEAAPTLGAAFELAASLAELIDEAARWGIDLAARLPSLAPDQLALHWQVTLDFLSIVTTHWPQALRALGCADPAARQAALLDAQAKLWRIAPEGPVWLAGIVAATPAETGLAGVVAGLPNGRVILPGVDLTLDAETWDAVGDHHPQAGFRRLLAGLGATRGDVRCLGDDSPMPRAALLRRAMLPERAVAATWREPARLDAAGLSVIDASDERTEAIAIALALRDAIEIPGRTAALVTPDRALAQRVDAELGRFGVLADDSAGEPLAETPQGVFLRLLAATLAGGFPPATLLALLKHPFAQLGGTQAACRRDARRLERACLRGPRPQPGIEGLRRALAAARIDGSDREAVGQFIDRLAWATGPLADLAVQDRVLPASLADALVETAERLADPDTIWSGEEGEAMAAHMAELSASLAVLAPERPDCLPGLLDASLAGVNVYGRRALRGHDAAEIHPRVSIWGLLEARGQSADLLVLGGLTEGTWPAATDPGPWMGRPMRAAIGLPNPEMAIGAAAHDFATLACAAPAVILSYPRRRDRAPAVPSRWIARLEACLAGVDLALAASPALLWANALDQPDGPPRPASPPTPRPPVARRPRQLSVTEVETWLRDPYAIYAAHVLRLRPLAPIEEEADRALFGNLVHDVLSGAYRDGAVDAASLQARFDAALERGVRSGVAAWWRPRLRRIADWIAATEAARRAHAAPDHVATEIAGRHILDADAGPFTLTGRADRIEQRAGALAILDYKTGTVPQSKDMRDGWSPQLPLEATMAVLGGFGDAFRDNPVHEVAHWKLSGGPVAGDIRALQAGDALDKLLADTWHGLEQRIEAFDDPATPYLAQPYPSRVPRYNSYAVLARVAEWRVTEDGE